MYLVSGGFRSLIEPVAELIGVPKSNVFANRLKFFFNGKFLSKRWRDEIPQRVGKVDRI